MQRRTRGDTRRPDVHGCPGRLGIGRLTDVDDLPGLARGRAHGSYRTRGTVHVLLPRTMTASGGRGAAARARRPVVATTGRSSIFSSTAVCPARSGTSTYPARSRPGSSPSRGDLRRERLGAGRRGDRSCMYRPTPETRSRIAHRTTADRPHGSSPERAAAMAPARRRERSSCTRRPAEGWPHRANTRTRFHRRHHPARPRPANEAGAPTHRSRGDRRALPRRSRPV